MKRNKGQRKRGSKTPTGSADPRLLARINEYASLICNQEQNKNADNPTASSVPRYVDGDALMEYLCTAYPEYQRKPQAQFRSYTERTLRELLAAREKAERLANNDDTDTTPDYASVAMMDIKDTNIMNASLVSRYRHKQQKMQQVLQPAQVVLDIFDYPVPTAMGIVPSTTNPINPTPQQPPVALVNIASPTFASLSSHPSSACPTPPPTSPAFPFSAPTTPATIYSVDAHPLSPPSMEQYNDQLVLPTTTTTTTTTSTTSTSERNNANNTNSTNNIKQRKEEEEEEEDDGNTTDTAKKGKKRSRSATRRQKAKRNVDKSLRGDKMKKYKGGANMGKFFGGGGGGGEGGADGPQGGHIGTSPIPNIRYSDLGGMEEVLQDVKELIEWPITHPELYAHLGITPSNGILLHGPTGCGKTMLANAIAGELQVPFFKVAAPEVVSSMSGESESKLRNLFADAKAMAPALIFIDEIDAITPNRETTEREMSRRIVAQFLACMDELSSNETGAAVIVIGATNRPDSLDPALRTAGRFAREISIGIPNEAAREKILTVLASKLKLAGDFNFQRVAHLTPGFVGADLGALTREAANIAVHRIFSDVLKSQTREPADPIVPPPALEEEGEKSEEKEKTSDDKEGMEVDSAQVVLQSAETKQEVKSRMLLERQRTSERLRTQAVLRPDQLASLAITMADFLEAIKKVQPSAKREGFATVPDVSWDDVGALDKLRSEMNSEVLEPIRRPQLYARMGLSAPAGVLLYGPPGCGKTLLAKAIANEGGFNFISVKGPELLNKFVGESERGVRSVFQRGRASAPCIIFFDEIDALCPRRESDGTNNATQRVVNQLLTELDGIEVRKDVFIIAATNRPDIIDPAMLRPGRLNKLLYVSLPTPDDRVQILRTITRNIPLHLDIDLTQIGYRADRFSGADLTALIREASMEAVKEAVGVHPDLLDPATHPSLCINTNHIQTAFSKIKPSVSPQDERMYREKAFGMAMSGSISEIGGSSATSTDSYSPTPNKAKKRRLKKKARRDSVSSAADHGSSLPLPIVPGLLIEGGRVVAIEGLEGEGGGEKGDSNKQE